jgi:HEAT repeat protein
MAEPVEQKPFDLDTAIEKLRHAEENIRLAALGEILGAKAHPRALDAVAGCLDDASERVRGTAIVVLSESGPKAVPALAGALDEKQPPPIRILAAAGLARAGADAAPAIDALVRCLGAKNTELPAHAALALGKIGTPAVLALRKALAHPDPGVRGAAADALGHAGPSAREAIEDLNKLAAAASPPALGLAYAAAIAKISGDPKAGLPALIEALKDKNDQLRASVIEKIGEMRALARDAASAIMERLKDPAAKVRANAALGLARIEASSPEVIAALTRTLGDPEAEVRINAAIALGTFGPACASAMPQLRAMQGDKDARAAAVANAALERIAGNKEKVDSKP